MQTTIWIDTVSTSLSESISLLTDPLPDDTSGEYIRWNFQKALDHNIVERIGGYEVTYNMVKYSYDQLQDGGYQRREGFIIAHAYDNTIAYIIDKNSGAMKFLRRFLSYEGRGELISGSFNFSSDFFLWMIARVYNKNNVIKSMFNDDEIHLLAIKGIKGDTEDSLTTVSADGETVMNTISALSFLLESANLIQIKLDTKYAEHICVPIALKNSVVTAEVAQYIGPFSENDYELKVSKICLAIYLDILPSLKQEYFTDIDDELWGERNYKDFIRKVAATLNTSIEQKLSTICEL